MQSNACSSIAAIASSPVGNQFHLNIVVSQQSLDTQPLSWIVLDDQQPLASRRGVSRMRVIAAASPSVVVGLVTNAKAPCDRPWCQSSSRVSI